VGQPSYQPDRQFLRR